MFQGLKIIKNKIISVKKKQVCDVLYTANPHKYWLLFVLYNLSASHYAHFLELLLKLRIYSFLSLSTILTP